MSSFLEGNIDEQVKEKTEIFEKKLSSDMHYKSEMYGKGMSFEWLKQIEFACPYIDNIVRAPKLILINDENVVKIEKARKITVASVKDLSRHTEFIDKVDPVTQEVQPSKILDVRSDETFNTYENRFIYTLLTHLAIYLSKKEKALNNIDLNSNKVLEYAATTNTTSEKVNIEIKIVADELPNDNNENNLQKELEQIRTRFKRIKEYMSSWQRSELVQGLDKAHVPLVKPPLSKTNLILKNPNFQVAVKLWEFLQQYDYVEEDSTNNNLDTEGNNTLKSILDHTFLTTYYVLDSVSKTKKEQKEKLSKYAAVMINKEISKVITILLDSGISITDEEIMKMVADAIKEEKSKRLAQGSDIKEKFKEAMKEYLERTQDYL